MEGKASSNLKARLDDHDYDESQLISIKVPAEHFVYYNNSKQFDRVDGQIEINGIQYQYVKKRLYQDSLEYLCIPNDDATKLKSAKDEFFKLVNDLQHPGQNKKSDSRSGSKSFSLDTYTVNDFFVLGKIDFTAVRRNCSQNSPTATGCSTATEQPPDHC
jgi:hypothetical protein